MVVETCNDVQPQGMIEESESFIGSKENAPTIKSPRTSIANDCLTFNIYGKRKIKIYKQLLILKIALFVFSTGSGGTNMCFPLFLQSRGINIEELSATIAASACLQFFVPFLSGIIADKIGRAKPILLFYLCCLMIISLCFTFLPAVEKCTDRKFNCSSIEDMHLAEASTACNRTSKFDFCFDENYNCSVSFDDEHQNGVVLNQCHSNSIAHEALNHVMCSEPTNCVVHCEVPNETCSNGKTLLWVYFLLIPLFYFLRTTVVSFYDVTIVNLVKEYGASYSMQRIWILLGSMAGNFLSGYIVMGAEGNDYTRFVYFLITCCSLGGILFFIIDIHPLQPNKKMLHTTKILLRNPDLFAFVLVVTVCGIALGVEVVYYSWYLKDLEAPPYIIGLIATVANASGLPFLFASKCMIKKLKSKNIFVIALLSHGIYCVSFSYLQSAWPAFVLVMLFGVFMELFWVSAIHFCQKIAPSGMISTVIATTSTIHSNMGIALSSLYGGIIIPQYGLRKAYRFIGFTAFAGALLYATFLLSMFFHKKRRAKSLANTEIKEASPIEDL